MLWTAGQARLERAEQDRLTELYTGVRDGYIAGEVQAQRIRFRGGYEFPAYIRRRDGVDRSPANRNRTLTQLAGMFPGVVRRSDS